MSQAKELNKASGLFFLSGFMLSKLQYLPFAVVSAVFRIISLGLYFVGYSLWLGASLLQKEHDDSSEHKDKLYSFAKVKEQFAVSSFIGAIATALSIAAIFVPVLFPPAAWLFFIGNAVWAIAEYHKLKKQLPEAEATDFFETKQKAYFRYAASSMAMSLITAISTTLIILFPPAAIAIAMFSLLITIGLGILTLEYCLDYNCGDHKPTPIIGSHARMANDLGKAQAPENDNQAQPIAEQEPFHGPNPLNAEGASVPLNVEITEDNSKQDGVQRRNSL